MIATVILVVLLCFVLWQVYETIAAYGRATGTVSERIKAAFKESVTIFWSRINTVSMAAITLLTSASEWMGAPGFKEALQPWLNPEYMLIYLLVIAIGAEIARRRTA